MADIIQFVDGQPARAEDLNTNFARLNTEARPVNHGGTGATSFTPNGVLVGNGTNPISAVSPGAVGQVLQIPMGGGTPIWANLPQAYNFIFNSDLELWGAGTTAAPTGWTGGGGFALGKASGAGFFKFGTASAALQRTTTDAYLIQDVALIYPPVTSWRGVTVTLGGWVKATVAGRGFLQINDGVSTYTSGYHTGSGNFEFLTVTATLNAAATQVLCIGGITGGNTTCYYDGLILAIAPSLTSWTPSGWTGRRSMLFAACTNPSATIYYCVYSGQSTTADTATTGYGRMPFNCVVTGMLCGTNAAPGVGKWIDFLLRKEGADQNGLGFDVLIQDTATEAQTTASSQCAFSQGDTWSVKVIGQAGVGTTLAHATLLIEQVP